MREELQSILADFDYQQALDWFLEHVPGRFFLKDMLKTGEDQFNKSKLIEALREVEQGLPPLDTRHSKPQVQSAERQVSAAQTIVAHAAPSMKEFLLDEQWKPLYKEANHYFETIGFLPTTAERKEAAFKILELMDQVERIWEEKDFIKKHGQAPDFQDQGIESLTDAQMITRINTLRSYISKANKGKLKKDRIPEWEAEKAELERRVRG